MILFRKKLKKLNLKDLGLKGEGRETKYLPGATIFLHSGEVGELIQIATIPSDANPRFFTEGDVTTIKGIIYQVVLAGLGTPLIVKKEWEQKK